MADGEPEVEVDRGRNLREEAEADKNLAACSLSPSNENPRNMSGSIPSNSLEGPVTEEESSGCSETMALSKYRMSIIPLTCGLKGGTVSFRSKLSQSIVRNHGCFFTFSDPFAPYPSRSWGFRLNN